MPDPVSEAARQFGDRAKAARDAAGLSQQAVADRAGLHVSYYGQIERGARNVALHNILRVAAALEVRPGELLDGLPDPDAPPPPTRRRSQRDR